MHTCHSTMKLFSCKISSQGSYTLKKYLRVSLQLGNNLFDEFFKEKMQPESEKSIFDPMKGTSVKTFTWSHKPLNLKVHDKGFIVQCPLDKDKENIDMWSLIGEREIKNVQLSLLNPVRSLIKGDVGKSSAVDEILKFANTKPRTQVPHDFFVCYIIDGMAVLNKINPNRTWVKQGAGLAAAFNMSIDTHTNDATSVIVAFGCCCDISLKISNENIQAR